MMISHEPVDELRSVASKNQTLPLDMTGSGWETDALRASLRNNRSAPVCSMQGGMDGVDAGGHSDSSAAVLILRAATARSSVRQAQRAMRWIHPLRLPLRAQLCAPHYSLLLTPVCAPPSNPPPAPSLHLCIAPHTPTPAYPLGPSQDPNSDRERERNVRARPPPDVHPTAVRVRRAVVF